MRKLMALVIGFCGFCFVLVAGTSFASTLNFSSAPYSLISFDGDSETFTFLPGFDGADFYITSGGSILPGNITGTFEIDGVADIIPGFVQVGPVTSTNGIFTIDDFEGNLFTGALEWYSISTIGAIGGLNIQSMVNMTGITYAGSNPGLVFMRDAGSATAVLTFQFSSMVTLEDLITPGETYSTSYSGSLTAVPVPAAVVLFGSGLTGLLMIRRKFHI